MRRALVTTFWIVLGCGPTVPVGGDSGASDDTASETSGGAPDDVGGSSSVDGPDVTGPPGPDVTGPPGTDGPAVTSGDPGDGDSSSTGGLPELVPAGSVVTEVGCVGDGGTQLYIRIYFVDPIDACAPSPDLGADNLLSILVSDWNTLSGPIEIAPNLPAIAAFRMEDLTGTVDVEVFAPTHPSTATLDLHGPSVSFQGWIDLQQCTIENEAPCPSPPDGG